VPLGEAVPGLGYHFQGLGRRPFTVIKEEDRSLVQLYDSFVVHRKLPQTPHSVGLGAADPYKFTDRDVDHGLTAVKSLEAVAR
jgi:hypothetical protein